MATTTINTRLALKTDISANWENSSLVLLKGEPAIEITDSGAFKFKFGDGVKTFSELPYATLSPTEISSLITDGAVQSVSISSGDSNGQIAITVDGTKTNASVKGLGSAAFTNSNAYATASHSHAIANVTGLQTALDGKAAKSHTHDDRYYTEAEVNTKLAGKANSSHTHGNGDITSLDASKLTGTISIDRLPAGALERCVIVETDADRLKLTTASVQKGDTVKVTGTGKMYLVIDDTKLTSEDGYTVYTAGSATSVPWSGVTGKPSTFTPSTHTHTKSQITDFPTSMPASDVYAWAKAASKPSYTKAEVGLGNVNNTADADKSVKYATSAGTATNVAGGSANTTSEKYRHVWFSDSATETARAYNDALKYDPKSNTMTVNISGSAASAATASNASKVNGHTVNSDVPSGAKFTDTNTTYPISYRTIDNNFASKYRTQTKGNTSAGDYISTLRCETNLVPYAPQYGSGLGWGRGDTHGYLYMNYNSPQVYVGAGNADKLNWAKQLAFADHTHSYTEITNRPTLIKAVSKNGYWGMADHDGSDSNWIRTTTAGIIPYQSGGAGGGHCGLGTSSWYFSNAYIDTVNCVNASVSGHIDAAGYIQSSNLINTYFEYQSNRGTIDWRFGSATGTGDENFFGFYDAKTGKIPLALDGNFGNIYVGFNVGGLNQKTSVGVYLGAQVSGNRAFIYHGDSYAGSIWIQTRLDGSWKWFSLGRACSTALSDIRLKGDIKDTEVEDATKVIE